MVSNDPISDYMQRHGCGFPEALEALAAQLGPPTARDIRRALQTLGAGGTAYGAGSHSWILNTPLFPIDILLAFAGYLNRARRPDAADGVIEGQIAKTIDMPPTIPPIRCPACSPARSIGHS